MTNARFPLMTASQYEDARAAARAEIRESAPVHMKNGQTFIRICDSADPGYGTRVFEEVTCPACIRMTLDVLESGGDPDVDFADDAE